MTNTESVSGCLHESPHYSFDQSGTVATLEERSAPPSGDCIPTTSEGWPVISPPLPEPDNFFVEPADAPPTGFTHLSLPEANQELRESLSLITSSPAPTEAECGGGSSFHNDLSGVDSSSPPKSAADGLDSPHSSRRVVRSSASVKRCTVPSLASQVATGRPVRAIQSPSPARRSAASKDSASGGLSRPFSTRVSNVASGASATRPGCTPASAQPTTPVSLASGGLGALHRNTDNSRSSTRTKRAARDVYPRVKTAQSPPALNSQASFLPHLATASGKGHFGSHSRNVRGHEGSPLTATSTAQRSVTVGPRGNSPASAGASRLTSVALQPGSVYSTSAGPSMAANSRHVLSSDRASLPGLSSGRVVSPTHCRHPKSDTKCASPTKGSITVGSPQVESQSATQTAFLQRILASGRSRSTIDSPEGLAHSLRPREPAAFNELGSRAHQRRQATRNAMPPNTAETLCFSSVSSGLTTTTDTAVSSPGSFSLGKPASPGSTSNRGPKQSPAPSHFASTAPRRAKTSNQQPKLRSCCPPIADGQPERRSSLLTPASPLSSPHLTASAASAAAIYKTSMSHRSSELTSPVQTWPSNLRSGLMPLDSVEAMIALEPRSLSLESKVTSSSPRLHSVLKGGGSKGSASPTWQVASKGKDCSNRMIPSTQVTSPLSPSACGRTRNAVAEPAGPQLPVSNRFVKPTQSSIAYTRPSSNHRQVRRPTTGARTSQVQSSPGFIRLTTLESGKGKNIPASVLVSSSEGGHQLGDDAAKPLPAKLASHKMSDAVSVHSPSAGGALTHSVEGEAEACGGSQNAPPEGHDGTRESASDTAKTFAETIANAGLSPSEPTSKSPRTPTLPSTQTSSTRDERPSSALTDISDRSSSANDYSSPNGSVGGFFIAQADSSAASMELVTTLKDRQVASMQLCSNTLRSQANATNERSNREATLERHRQNIHTEVRLQPSIDLIAEYASSQKAVSLETASPSYACRGNDLAGDLGAECPARKAASAALVTWMTPAPLESPASPRDSVKSPERPISTMASSSSSKFRREGFVTSNEGPLSESYEMGAGRLGQGTYGTVREAVEKGSKLRRAIKTITKNRVKNLSRFRLEIDIMKGLDHPHIIKLYETFEDTKNIYLVLELCQGGELFDRVIEMGCFSEAFAAILMRQIIAAVFYCHEHHIAHRDLKPENFLFLDRTPTSPLKIIDFGLATRCQPGTSILKTRAGTPFYVAPEVLSGGYGLQCDVWSAGVIMFILLCGYPPFHGDTDAEILKRVKLGKYDIEEDAEWRNVSKEAKDLIRCLLRYNPSERYTAEQALKHPWLRCTEPTPQLLQEKLQPAILDNFKKFRALSQLKKAALTVIALHLSEFQIADLKEIFLALDKDGNGSLTVQEVKDGFNKSDCASLITPDELEVLLRDVDSDGSGVIDYTEFIAAAVDYSQYTGEEVCRTAFRVFDLDANGKISPQELYKVLGPVPDSRGELLDEAEQVSAEMEKIKLMIQEFDQNGDGEIDFQEFLSMMRSHAK